MPPSYAFSQYIDKKFPSKINRKKVQKNILTVNHKQDKQLKKELIEQKYINRNNLRGLNGSLENSQIIND